MIDTNWREKDEAWRKRSEQLFKGVESATDERSMNLAWYAACLSEQQRLEWKYWQLYWQLFQ